MLPLGIKELKRYSDSMCFFSNLKTLFQKLGPIVETENLASVV